MTAIESAAVAWVALRHASVRLRRERNGVVCLAEERDEPEVGWVGREPCFKVTAGESPDGKAVYDRAPISDWCPRCQQRQAIHDAYRIVNKAAGIANRALQMRCRGVAETRAEAMRQWCDHVALTPDELARLGWTVVKGRFVPDAPRNTRKAKA